MFISQLNKIMMHELLLKLTEPFFNLVFRLWISFIFIQALFLKDCLDFFLWACFKLKILVAWILLTLRTNNSSVCNAFMNEIQKEFSNPILEKLSVAASTNLIKTPGNQIQRNELHSEVKNNGQCVCQNCQNTSDFLLHYKNSIKSSRDSSPIRDSIKHSVSTQTTIEHDFLNNSQLHVQTQTHNSIIGKEELNSSEEFFRDLENDFKCQLTPLSSSFSECKNNARVLRMESVTDLGPKMNSEDFIPSQPQNVSRLLESPICQINLGHLQFSQDVFPSLSPEEKSIFRKSWNKLKLTRKVDKQQINPGITTLSQQLIANIPLSRASETENESNLTGCCSNMFHRLKSKYDQSEKKNSIVYKKF